MTGRPMRRVRFGSEKAWMVVSWDTCVGRDEAWKGTCIGVVVLRQHVKKAAVDIRLGVVELGDVGVFQPIYHRLCA